MQFYYRSQMVYLDLVYQMIMVVALHKVGGTKNEIWTLGPRTIRPVYTGWFTGATLLASVNYPRVKARLVNCPGEFTDQDSGKSS